MKKYIFPKSFLWGTSSAAYQVEGNNINSDWWNWEKLKKIPVSGIACDHYRRYQEDFKLAKKLGHNAHRLSIEWARIFPEKDQINKKELNHYLTVLKYLKSKGFTTFVTLHHFTLPKWFADMGGFEKAGNLKYFYKYVEVSSRMFNQYIDYWITFNEPSTYVAKSYLLGDWPPQKRNIFKAFQVARNLNTAHNNTYIIIKKEHPNAQIGSSHFFISYSYSGNFITHIFTKISNFIANDIFFNATYKSYDFIGLNYYFNNKVALKNLSHSLSVKETELILEDKGHKFGWYMKPEGIYLALHYLKKRFNKPIFITENGISDPSDKKRGRYIRNILINTYKAIQDGVDVRGYLHWTLTDNYEWNLAYRSKFGLVKVDRNTMIRTVKKSAYLYKRICETNSIT